MLLDVYEQCVVISEAHEQYKCHRSGGQATLEASRRKEVEASLRTQIETAVSTLVDLWHRAIEHGVEDSALKLVTEKYLPTELVIENGKVVLPK